MSSRIPTPARLQELFRLQCFVFGKVHNPEAKRIGTKVLRESLKGPQIRNYYYPSKQILPTPAKLNKIFGNWTTVDPEEEHRLERNEYLRRKGKGAPKKLKEKKVIEKKRK
ncbi:Mitochondrial 37S ribosomal protein S27 [Wickerhamiella sorbophila]|uniref:Small ribosomal subunit protein mS33 n=1 Tax=Wickerhamiella sorbophila TaxID=45607 RepID=A0A2T0FP02_9ASCO|nr:Mitochondrial 37S ribosomal protein S27 [Wickerhamiella sorbophila]PRT56721.1 Mitochondrial 37S ribosomal protein S27 [Wickerhamiella sorbophila]